jgi:hypothetical protein
MAVHKASPVAFLPIPARRNDIHYDLLPGRLRANPPLPKDKNAVVLEADAVIVDLQSPNWFSLREGSVPHPIPTAYPDPLPEAYPQLPSYLQRAFLEAYRYQAKPRSSRPSTGALVNLTA